MAFGSERKHARMSLLGCARATSSAMQALPLSLLPVNTATLGSHSAPALEEAARQHHRRIGVGKIYSSVVCIT